MVITLKDDQLTQEIDSLWHRERLPSRAAAVRSVLRRGLCGWMDFGEMEIAIERFREMDMVADRATAIAMLVQAGLAARGYGV